MASVDLALYPGYEAKASSYLYLNYVLQDQVNNGVPLPTCLMLFGRWLRKLTEERGVLLIEPGQKYSEDMTLCALVTWTG